MIDLKREGDVFDAVRERLQRSSGRIRQRGTDYLTYALIDSIVDSYFHILEKAGINSPGGVDKDVRAATGFCHFGYSFGHLVHISDIGSDRAKTLVGTATDTLHRTLCQSHPTPVASYQPDVSPLL